MPFCPLGLDGVSATATAGAAVSMVKACASDRAVSPRGPVCSARTVYRPSASAGDACTLHEPSVAGSVWTASSGDPDVDEPAHTLAVTNDDVPPPPANPGEAFAMYDPSVGTASVAAAGESAGPC